MQYVWIALLAIGTNKLRAILTMVIIALGIMALVGMVTALSSIQNSVRTNLAEMGANTFKIKKKGGDTRYGDRGEAQQSAQRIGYRQTQFFKEHYRYPSRVSAHFELTSRARVQYKGQKTNPEVIVKGIDNNFIYTSGLTIDQGRNFTKAEIRSGTNTAIIGKNLKFKLFGYRQAVGEDISIGNKGYRIIGVLKLKGSSMSFSGDNSVLIPYNNARVAFRDKKPDYNISVKVKNVQELEEATREAIGIFRVARGLGVKEKNDFNIAKSDNLADRVQNNLWFVKVATYMIGFITLLGAAIGLMNIMLVSVKERTREIGTRKALGASTSAIQTQFLSEAILISQIGGFIGILLGITVGNGVAWYMGNQFAVPWGWALGGFIICFVVGTAAGYYPAKRAAKLDPIEALRYE